MKRTKPKKVIGDRSGVWLCKGPGVLVRVWLVGAGFYEAAPVGWRLLRGPWFHLRGTYVGGHSVGTNALSGSELWWRNFLVEAKNHYEDLSPNLFNGDNY